ncbi:hypothetical protein GQ37_021240 [Janthinobacterium sp. BJB1]|nr:hypothetical protein GQ37_021240 [Janthinobacterium sp. BJB1]
MFFPPVPRRLRRPLPAARRRPSRRPSSSLCRPNPPMPRMPRMWRRPPSCLPSLPPCPAGRATTCAPPGQPSWPRAACW